MRRETIRKSIEIHAPREKVWNVLLTDAAIRTWYSAFSEGCYAETDWKIGSKALFMDDTRCGLIGTVIANIPHELISVKYNGILINGEEHYDSDSAGHIKDGVETYILSGNGGITRLSVACDTGIEFLDFMSAAWDEALLIIQELSEENSAY